MLSSSIWKQQEGQCGQGRRWVFSGSAYSLVQSFPTVLFTVLYSMVTVSPCVDELTIVDGHVWPWERKDESRVFLPMSSWPVGISVGRRSGSTAPEHHAKKGKEKEFVILPSCCTVRSLWIGRLLFIGFRSKSTPTVRLYLRLSREFRSFGLFYTLTLGC